MYTREDVMRVAEAVRLASARVAYPHDEHYRRAVELGQKPLRMGIEALDLVPIVDEALKGGP